MKMLHKKMPMRLKLIKVVLITNNISVTVGVYWQKDDRKDVNNWTNNPDLTGSVSYV
jgi:hypothetical protein